MDYLSPRSAIKLYYPDFVAIQKNGEEIVSWILETKGREDENVAHKDAASSTWCEKISAQTGKEWMYKKVPQALFDKFKEKKLSDLIRFIDHQGIPEVGFFRER